MTDFNESSRREFLGTLGAGFLIGGGVRALAAPESLSVISKKQKRVLVVYMAGGLSQLESWDPKPKTDTGGPFRAIPTSVTGTHICELLPKTAKHMDKLALVRGINTRNGDHGKGRYHMTRGYNRKPGIEYPHLGAVCAKGLETPGFPLPGHIKVPGSRRGNDSAYLGPRYSSVGAGGSPPANSTRPSTLTEKSDARRNELRRKLNSRFTKGRKAAETDAYAINYERALRLMEQRDVFDVSKESAKDQERYGKFDLGKHALLARRLLEAGVPYVQIQHSNYDTHNENFAFHLEQLGEFDRAFSALIGDLHDRGMLESTLVVVMSEFGRTPRINPRYGRDHWGNAWSVCLGGAGIKPGAVVGKTNKNGTKVIERQVDHANLFHTYLRAVGLDSSGTFDIAGRKVPLADPAKQPISELLA